MVLAAEKNRARTISGVNLLKGINWVMEERFPKPGYVSFSRSSSQRLDNVQASLIDAGSPEDFDANRKSTRVMMLSSQSFQY